ncbi:hypothetical protein [Streptomyces roseochromogenus]|nr:hypothetical protein [Streptomyces roseochromogenus]
MATAAEVPTLAEQPDAEISDLYRQLAEAGLSLSLTQRCVQDTQVGLAEDAGLSRAAARAAVSARVAEARAAVTQAAGRRRRAERGDRFVAAVGGGRLQDRGDQTGGRGEGQGGQGGGRGLGGEHAGQRAAVDVSGQVQGAREDGGRWRTG